MDRITKDTLSTYNMGLGFKPDPRPEPGRDSGDDETLRTLN